MAFNIPYEWCVILMAVITAVYVILGGYMATAINDFIQGIIMLAGIVAGHRGGCSQAREASWRQWERWPGSPATWR